MVGVEPADPASDSVAAEVFIHGYVRHLLMATDFELKDAVLFTLIERRILDRKPPEEGLGRPITSSSGTPHVL